MPEEKAPKAICIQPKRAEALPASCRIGDSAMAEVFGKIKPYPNRKKKISANSTGRVNRLRLNTDTIQIPIKACQILAHLEISALVHFFRNQRFNWVANTMAEATKAKAKTILALG